MRRLPRWIAGGPEVSDLAYRIVELWFDDEVGEVDTIFDAVTLMAQRLDVDHGDILTALAELARANVLDTRSSA